MKKERHQEFIKLILKEDNKFIQKVRDILVKMKPDVNIDGLVEITNMMYLLDKDNYEILEDFIIDELAPFLSINKMELLLHNLGDELYSVEREYKTFIAKITILMKKEYEECMTFSGETVFCITCFMLSIPIILFAVFTAMI